jgi:hypothetical protein
MNNLEVHHFPSYGYLQDRIPEDLYNSLLRYISLEENKKIKYNKELAGQIEEEYFLSNIDEEFYIKLEKYLLDLVDVYDDIFKYNSRYKISINNMPFKLGTLWVNYQKKYEYNPIHDHSGVYSFVIWIKIPYNLKDEEKNPSSINSFPTESVNRIVFFLICSPNLFLSISITQIVSANSLSLEISARFSDDPNVVKTLPSVWL